MDIETILFGFGQSHLIGNLKTFSVEDLRNLREQMKRFSPEKIAELKKCWRNPRSVEPFEPFKDSPYAHDQVEKSSCSHTGSVILAGGVGSRLGFNGPKGLFEIKGKSLFQYLLEKVDLSHHPIAIMTSPLNHRETEAFLEKNAFFGCKKVRLFQQELLPVLNDEGHWFWQKPGMIAESPDGNGSFFKELAKAKLLDFFEQEKTERLQIMQIENPLATPNDGILDRFHQTQDGDVVIKCVKREDSDEKMGLLVLRSGKIEIVEYSEIDEEFMRQENDEGALEYPFGNTGQYSMKLSFVREMSKRELPLHWAYKSGSWKAERFIFDCLAHAKKTSSLCYPREACYSPLKCKDHLANLEKLLTAAKMS